MPINTATLATSLNTSLTENISSDRQPNIPSIEMDFCELVFTLS